MKNYILGCLTLGMMTACTNAQSKNTKTEEKKPIQQTIHVPFEKGMEIEREVKLSDIASSVEYVRLETTDEGLVHYLMPNMMHRTSKYFIFGDRKNVMQFTIDGKFVRNIGRQGKGPGEYNYIRQVDVDEKAGKVYVLSSGRRFNVYDLETGKFLQSGALTNKNPDTFLMLNDSTMVGYQQNSNGQEQIMAYISTLSGNIQKEYSRHQLFEIKSRTSYMYGGLHDFNLQRYDGTINLKEYENDTVYSVTPDGMKKRYIFDTGKYGIKLEHTYHALDGDDEAFNRLSAGYIRYSVLETKNYLFLPYIYWAGKGKNKPRTAIYDKRTGECYKIKDNIFKDDITNGLYLYFPHCALDEKTLIISFEADQIFQIAEGNPELLKHPQLQGLQEGDNPVLMIVKLK